MSRLRLIRHLAAAGLVFGLAGGPARAGEAAGLGVRTGLHKDFTRLVLETARPVPYKFAFPGRDEIVLTVSGAAPAAADTPRARGIIRAIEVTPTERGSRLVIKTRQPADIRRQFTLLPGDGRGARIVIDLAAADGPEPRRPRVLLPAPHTSITGALVPAPAGRQARARRTEPFEVAAAGGAEMLFDGGPAEALARPVELAQAGGLSVNDWLFREGGNPNVRAVPPAPAPSQTVNPPAPPAYPAYRSYPAQPAAQTHPAHPGYRAPARQAPPPASAWAPPERAAPPAPAGDAAARYASQKQAVSAEDLAPARPRRFYAGVGLGLGMLDYESDLNNTTVDEDLLTWKLTGGYRPSDFLALEMSFGTVGSFTETLPSGTAFESTLRAFTIGSLLSLPLNSRMSPFARAGVAFWWEDADDAAPVSRSEESGTGVVVGLGADYRFSDRIGLRGEWELYLLSDKAYTNVFSASLLYNF